MFPQSAHTAAIRRELLWLGAMNAASVSTLYWAQSLVLQAAAEFGASPFVRLMPAAALAGYAAGVALQAAVARDLTSPAGLGLHVLVLISGLCVAASAPAPTIAAIACFAVGAGCSLTQRLLACATSAVSAKARSETIGWIIAGGLFGIIMARACVPFASSWLGWRAMFWADAAIVTVLGAGAILAAGRLSPPARENTRPLLPSAAALWWREGALRHAALQQAIVFAAFNFGWALFPRLLAHDGVAPTMPMGIVASLGACAAILTGRLCRWWDPAQLAGAGLLAGVGALILLLTAGDTLSLYGAPMAVLDIATQVALVANQTRAQALASSPAMRGRVTAMVTTIGFGGGALGATLGNLIG